MRGKIQNIDPLRGLLALCVVLYHIPQISHAVQLPYFDNAAIFHKGPKAVSVFFCLSGFLIIGLLYDEKSKFGRINIRKFYIRRILRLYPVYYLVLIFGLLYYHFLLPLFGVTYELNYTFIEGLVWNIFFLPNVFTTLFEPGAILEILWSIGIEEQFYLLIAPLLSLTPLKKYQPYLLLFTLTYFVIFHLDAFFFFKKYYQLYFFMSAGGLVAILSRTRRIYFKSFYLRILVYSAFVSYFFTDLLNVENDFIQHTIDIILFNVLIVNLANESKFQVKGKMINYMGSISYGIYMYHMIVVNFVLFVFIKIQNIMSLSDWLVIILVNVLSVLFTVLFSHLSFKYYESYFLRLKRLFR